MIYINYLCRGYKSHPIIINKQSNRMKRLLIATFLIVFTWLTASAQEPFRGRFTNAEFKVFLTIDLYHRNITVPGQDLYGELPGYFGKENSTFYWLVIDAKTTGNKQAELTFINDYGSEDLTATLTMLNDSTFQLKQNKGSDLKIANGNRWLKLPKTIMLHRK